MEGGVNRRRGKVKRIFGKRLIKIGVLGDGGEDRKALWRKR